MNPTIPSRPQNNRFLLVLCILTSTFLLLVAFLYWQQTRPVAVVDSLPEFTVKKFSTYAGHGEVIKGYGSGARIIHDIESYSSIKSLFFASPIPELTDPKRVAAALAEVAVEQRNSTDFSDSHVLHTSYYIGNLLIYPGRTLHEVLASTTRTNTTILLETALADVRSGVVKIQNYFDSATPNQYRDTASSGVYFITPSFPSLTMAEAATVFYLLSEVDPLNARMYRLHLDQYANQVLTSGAHFRIDIDYALELAAAYHLIMSADPVYTDLINAAKEEWTNSLLVSAKDVITPRFVVSNFPASSRFSLEPGPNFTYKPEYINEQLSGSLMLSLIDKRLPEPVPKLYQYSLSEQILVPFAVDLVPRQFPEVGSAIQQAAYLDQSDYYFVSGKNSQLQGKDPYLFTTTNILHRDQTGIKNLTRSLNSESEPLTYLKPKVSTDRKKMLYTEFPTIAQADKNMWRVVLAGLENNNLGSEETIATGESPQFALNDEYILFLSNKVLYYVPVEANAKESINLIELANPRDIVQAVDFNYEEDTKTLLTYVTIFDPVNLQSDTKVSIYNLLEGGKVLSLEPTYDLTVSDAAVYSAKLSPGGRYMTLIMTETTNEEKPRVLILDIINGIIQKEIDLEAFASQSMVIDDWTLFN